MFELRNKDEIWYKTPEMYDWILYGRLYIVEPAELENQFVIKKFDFESETYKITNDFTEYEYNGKVYSVSDGMFEIEPEFIPEPQPTQLDRIEAAVNKSQQDIIDSYTLELIEGGIIS